MSGAGGPIDTHEDDPVSVPLDRALVLRLVRYLKPYRGAFALSVALLLLVSSTILVGPAIVKRAIDGPIRLYAEGEMAADAAKSAVIALSLVYVGLVLLQFGLRFAQSLVTVVTGQRVIRDVRREVFGHLQKQPVGYFDTHPVGALVSRVTGDVESLSEIFSSGAVVVFEDVFTLVVIAVVLLVIDVPLALVAFAMAPFVLVVSNVFRKRSREAYREVRKRYARLNAFLNEHVSGIRVTKLFRQEESAAAAFSRVNRAYVDSNIRSLLNFALFFPAIDLLAWISIGSILWFGGREIVASRLTYGEFVQFWFYVKFFYEPIRELSEKYNVLQAAMAASERIFRILDTKPAVAPPKVPRVPGPSSPKGELVFESVWFAYRGEEWVLKDVSFRVAPGEMVAVVGATGAGKSTLASLVSRLRDVGRGRVLVDGIDVREWDPKALKSRIAVVLQDVFLFAGSVIDNIRLGEGDAIPRQRAEAAARIVHADRFVRRMEKGYDAEVHERGATLSAGERQLLSFARALAFDPEILILDEATSSVDTETEALIQDATFKLLEGRTSLVIAHRLSTIKKADRIVVLHHGEVRESGRHEELLKKRGIYRRLYELQYVSREPRTAAAEPLAREGR